MLAPFRYESFLAHGRISKALAVSAAGCTSSAAILRPCAVAASAVEAGGFRAWDCTFRVRGKLTVGRGFCGRMWQSAWWASTATSWTAQLRGATCQSSSTSSWCDPHSFPAFQSCFSNAALDCSSSGAGCIVYAYLVQGHDYFYLCRMSYSFAVVSRVECWFKFSRLQISGPSFR